MSISFGEDAKVKRIGATDQVARQLRVMITDGRLPQGTKLPEVPLAEALGVSRNTLRDGIRVLASEGLVTHELNRGAVVRVLSPEDVSDIYDIRRRFELDALGSVKGADPSIRDRAQHALDACTSALRSDDYADFVENELEFHAALVAHLGSPRLDRLFTQVIGELRLLFSDLRSDSEPRLVRKILALYRDAYAAAERGQVKEAQKLLREHLDTYELRLRELAGARTDDAG